MRLSLATKILLALVGVLFLAVLSSVAAIVSAYRLESLQHSLVAENLPSVRAAEELEIALLEQRGYVSAFILDDGNEEWLQELDRRRDTFDIWLDEARKTARSKEERDILDRLETVQRAYASERDNVVTLYNAGRQAEAKESLLREVPALYQQAYDLCEQFLNINQQMVDSATARARNQVEQITAIVSVIVLITVGLGLALLWLFFQGVIFPLRRMAEDVRAAAGDAPRSMGELRQDEMRELGHYVQLLMTNVAETRTDLEQSRTQLAHAEKLATVGKLAASVAHEIRNPLTSMKMWLYSLRRSMEKDEDLRKKIDVVSEEIARLETIVRNFLEFSRPPQLRVSRNDVRRILDKTLEVAQLRLEAQQIHVERTDKHDLPDVECDAEQLMQVFVNLINNSIDAMPQGGEIRVDTSKSLRGGREMIVVEISDVGPGMPTDVQERIFEPFFTTKDEGTGLGLCIAASVMARHRGALNLESSNPDGTRWTIWIPTTN